MLVDWKRAQPGCRWFVGLIFALCCVDVVVANDDFQAIIDQLDQQIANDLAAAKALADSQSVVVAQEVVAEQDVVDQAAVDQADNRASTDVDERSATTTAVSVTSALPSDPPSDLPSDLPESSVQPSGAPVSSPQPSASQAKAEGKYITRVTDASYSSLLLGVYINEVNTGDAVRFLQASDPNVGLLAPEQAMRRWRIVTDKQPAVLIERDYYLSLDQFPGLTYTVDELDQSVRILAQSSVLLPTVVDFGAHQSSPLTPSSVGGFLNYSAFGASSSENNDVSLGGSAELGIFSPLGVLTSTWSAIESPQGGVDVSRLQTVFFRDFPDLIATLKVGDILTRGGTWGAGYQLAGFQFGTNFSTRPQMPISPVQIFDALMEYTSSFALEAYALDFDGDPSRNYYLFGSNPSLPPGPVQLVNVPTLSNGGYRLLIKDAQGNQRVVNQRYFFSRGLLRAGLHDYSVALGLRRDGLGDRYENGVFTLTDRFGVSSKLTMEFHLELNEQGVATGLSALYSVPFVGLAGLTLANSFVQDVDPARDEKYQQGSLLSASIENRYGDFGYAARYDFTSRRFAHPGFNNTANIKRRFFANFSAALPWDDTVNVSYTDSKSYESDSYTSAVTVGYGWRVFDRAVVSLAARYNIKPETNRTLSLGFSISFADIYEAVTGEFPYSSESLGRNYSLFEPQRTQFSTSISQDDEGTVSGDVGVSSAANVGEHNFNFAFRNDIQEINNRGLAVNYNNPWFSISGSASRANGRTNYGLGVLGGVAFIGGDVYFSPQVSGSFALIRLGENGAGFSVNGIKADSDGDVLLSSIIPYFNNPVSLTGDDLPLSIEPGELGFTINPHFRSGVIVDYPIPLVRDAMVRIEIVTNGKRLPLPLSAEVTVAGNEEIFPVGDDGRVYLFGIVQQPKLLVRLGLKTCELQIEIPENVSVDQIPELGPYLCEDM